MFFLAEHLGGSMDYIPERHYMLQSDTDTFKGAFPTAAESRWLAVHCQDSKDTLILGNRG